MPSASPPKRPLSNTLVLLALWIPFYASFTLFTPALLDDADSVHAEVAREMLLRHDWVTLYANGIRYLEKAPLLYWSMAASMRASQLLGHPSALCLAVAARIPLSLTILALAFAVEAFGRRAFRSARAGLYAALILLSSFGVFIFTRIIIPDAMVCLWLTLAMLCFWLTEQPQGRVPLVRPSSIATDVGSRSLCYAFAACCALNVLTKGLIGIVFPIAIVAIYLLLTRGLRGAISRIFELHPFSSTVIFLVLAAPWHLLAAWANPTRGFPGGLTYIHGHWSVPLPTDGNVHGWAWFYFVNEQLLRYLNLRVPRDYDTVPLWLFWGLCLIWLMPWSAFIFKAVTAALPIRSADWRRRLRLRALDGRERTLLFLVLWTAIPMLFFSFSTRQEYYVLPALPAMVLLIAAWLFQSARSPAEAEERSEPLVPAPCVTARLISADGKTITTHPAYRMNAAQSAILAARRAAPRVTASLLAFGSIFAAVSLLFLLHTRTPSPSTDLAQLVQQNPGDYALSMGHFLDLNAQALGFFRLPLAIAAASLFLGPLVSYILRKRFQPHAATLALAAGAFGFLLAAHLGLQTFAPVLSSQQLAAAIGRQVHPADLIVIHQEYEYASTLGFYLQRPGYVDHGGSLVAINPIHILTASSYNGVADYGRSSNLWYGSFFPDAPAIFETPQSLAGKWPGPQRIFLWQDLANQPSPLPASLSPVYFIAKSGGKEVVSNQPNRP
jgi:4-amino-4-deoxy-L-arabinose transferase-like glycosyltransferase